jgi:hypothetical protein
MTDAADKLAKDVAARLGIWLNGVNGTLRPVEHAIIGTFRVQHLYDLPHAATYYYIRGDVSAWRGRSPPSWEGPIRVSQGYSITTPQPHGVTPVHNWIWQIALPDDVSHYPAVAMIYQAATAAFERHFATLLEPHLIAWRTSRERTDIYLRLDDSFDTNP